MRIFGKRYGVWGRDHLSDGVMVWRQVWVWQASGLRRRGFSSCRSYCGFVERFVSWLRPTVAKWYPWETDGKVYSIGWAKDE